MPIDIPFAFLAAAGLSSFLVWLLARGYIGGKALDLPNERSLHTVPVPRKGGIGLLGATGVVWGVLSPGDFGAVVGIAAALAIVSFLDDLGGLPVTLRLAVQVLAALIFLFVYPVSPWFVSAVAFLTIVWACNLYNFMDGSDGLAGGMAVIGFGCYGIAAAAGGEQALALLAFILSGASFGFLFWNFHKASIFMGDVGSVPLGFLAASLGLVGWQRGVWPFWFPVLVFSPFIVDATITLLTRFFRGERLSQAHKTHYYQRALQLGLGHRGTAISEYVLMICAGGSALLARTWSALLVGLVLVCWGGVFVILMRVIDRRWARAKGLS